METVTLAWIEPDFAALPQVTPEDVAQLAQAGVRLLINNRPDGEAAGQPPGDAIASAAAQAGISYLAIPVTSLSEAVVAATRDALQNASGPVAAFCRSGQRSAALWACARAAEGRDPADLVARAASAGFDLSGLAPLLSGLALRAKLPG